MTLKKRIGFAGLIHEKVAQFQVFSFRYVTLFNHRQDFLKVIESRFDIVCGSFLGSLGSFLGEFFPRDGVLFSPVSLRVSLLVSL